MQKNEKRNRSSGYPAPDKPPTETSDLAALAWGRPSVTFRLTEERRKALLALTPELGMRASPTAAIDFAIERAAGLGAASLDRVADGMDDALDAGSDLRAVLAACAALRTDAEDARAALARVEQRLGAIGREMEPAPGATRRDQPAPPALSLGAWLAREAPQALAWAVVKARWLGATSAGSGKAMARVDAWVAAPIEFASQMAVVETLEVGPLRLAALAAFEDEPVAVLVCSRVAEGWSARIHALDAQGKLGPALDSFAA
ncbi:hypothetical protein ABIB42_002256 [Massilia sp. UYP32]|uniref:hypothetical protein n=1 Tax=Massilia sp. UYP32 TaxID=1756386 RepID=UPI003D24A022